LADVNPNLIILYILIMKKFLSIIAIIALSFSIASCTKDLNDYKDDVKELVEKEKKADKDEQKAINEEMRELVKSAKENLTPEEYSQLEDYYFSLYR